jgi:hypothetical protein
VLRCIRFHDSPKTGQKSPCMIAVGAAWAHEKDGGPVGAAVLYRFDGVPL